MNVARAPVDEIRDAAPGALGGCARFVLYVSVLLLLFGGAATNCRVQELADRVEMLERAR